MGMYGAGIWLAMELIFGEVWSWYLARYEAGIELAFGRIWSWYWGRYEAGMELVFS